MTGWIYSQTELSLIVQTENLYTMTSLQYCSKRLTVSVTVTLVDKSDPMTNTTL